jgi:hypothetical protein
MNDITRNIDPDVAAGFGHEWSTFRQGEKEFSTADREAIFQSYFQIFPWNELPLGAIGIDVGCGSGRWSVMVAPRVGHLHLLDASAEALAVARQIPTSAFTMPASTISRSRQIRLILLSRLAFCITYPIRWPPYDRSQAS